jgi:hypothetical protein
MESKFLTCMVQWLRCAVLGAAGVGTAAAAGAYSIIASIPGPDGMWDYAAVGYADQRLYLAQGEHISMLDLGGSGTWTRIDLPKATWHGVVPLGSHGLVLGTNGQTHALTLFDAKTRELVSEINTSSGPKSVLSGKLAQFAVLADPDALIFEPKSGLIAAVNGGSGEVVFVDIDRRSIIGRAQVGGKLEFAVADGRGSLYVNVQTAHEIAVIDTLRFTVTRRIPMADCIEPKGLAYDPGTDLLISACDNGIAKFMIAETGQPLVSLKIGGGADAVMVDGGRHRAFVASGDDAVLSIFDIEDPKHIALLQTLSTEKGTRLGAVDAQTGLLYLPSGKLGPPIAPRPWPSVVPGSFHVLVVGLSQPSRDR